MLNILQEYSKTVASFFENNLSHEIHYYTEYVNTNNTYQKIFHDAVNNGDSDSFRNVVVGV
jgi:hypothetical protein